MGNRYYSIGGQPAIEAAVRRFHERVKAGPDLACHFDGMDLRRIIAHQITLLGLFFGGTAAGSLPGGTVDAFSLRQQFDL